MLVYVMKVSSLALENCHNRFTHMHRTPIHRLCTRHKMSLLCAYSGACTVSCIHAVDIRPEACQVDVPSGVCVEIL
jgi:hypothetical protein